MIYPSILERKYKEYLPFVTETAERVKSTLVNFCETKGYAFSSRIKSIESLAEKIETGRFKRWSDLDDLFACTIIIPTLSHEDEVIKFCKKFFDIKRTVKRGQNKKSPDTFRFDSTRINAKLKKVDNLNLNNNELNIYSITFEIQIKSAFEHAWAVSTHDLVYKNSEIDWKRLRLAAQIKANVEQLDTLILAFEQTSIIIQENDYPEIKIKRKLAKEINNLFEIGKLPDELRPKDMNRLCDNLYRLLVPIGQEINNQGINRNIEIIKTKVTSTSLAQIPRSISLFQYILTILIRNKIIEIPLEKYHFHITEELTTIYPDITIDNDCIFIYSDDI